ncbi:MAG: type II CAAX prenyl endopeptidase Rce1 family protein [Anaerolineae bacterium]
MGQGLGLMLAVWLVANFVPHGLIYLFTGKVYLQFSPYAGFAGEISTMLLNLLLPLLALRYLSPARSTSLRDALAWRWRGWSTLGWGVLGYALGMAAALAINVGLGPPFSYGAGIQPASRLELVLLLLILVVLIAVTTLGEETMFRGYLQTELTERYGAWVGILLPALLFGLRHLPSDLYYGQGASPAMWLSRLSQLYLGAVVFGLTRHAARSTASTWIMHLLTYLTAIFLGRGQ